MKIGIFSKTFERDHFNEVIHELVKNQISCTQFNLMSAGLSSLPLEIPTQIVQLIGEQCRENDIEVSAVSATYNMIHPDRKVIEQGEKSLAEIAASCKYLNTNLITICTGTRDPHNQWKLHPDNQTDLAWRDLTQSMERALSLTETSGISLGIEPEAANVVNSAAKAQELIREMGSERLKIIFDPANLFERASVQQARDIIERAANMLVDHIWIAHAKDRDTEGNFQIAGEGMIDYGHYIGCLKSIGFEGPLILHGLPEEKVPQCVKFLRNHLD